ncbi:glutaminyl-peptide cyclotransferase-like [Tachypleus tridentatus]|uniref:glutaminyl-peptide cyclotransferase-like n=1 Tax=Tachypleus tridentatus TaxID=6853 RepID=UPI003FD37A4D
MTRTITEGLLLIFFLNNVFTSPVPGTDWLDRKWPIEPKLFSDEDIKTLSHAVASRQSDFNAILKNVLVPRVPGTIGHDNVKKYIIDSMKALQWDVEVDSFLDATPLGYKEFANVIATLNPKACQRLVLACHYDSKFSTNETLLGATDAAVPCAMIINLARLLDRQLKVQRTKNTHMTLQLIFFDGEEAFQKWMSTDSLYGSRHLASKWEQEPHDSECRENGTSQLDKIKMFVLLDLLGAENPRFISYFLDTHGVHTQFIYIEERLNSLHELESPTGKTNYFQTSSSSGFVQDDHVPFAERGVPVLHLVTHPFPEVWHKQTDNGNYLDYTVINNINKIVSLFVAQYLHLDISKRAFF